MTHSTFFARSSCSRTWWLVCLLASVLGLGNLTAVHAQPAFQINITPSGTVAVPAGNGYTLTASATYPAFAVGLGFNDAVKSVAIQSNGKILVGGNFTSYNGNPCNHIARLHLDGSFDNTFTTSSGFGGGNVNAIAIQSDGKIVVGGSFTSFNGSAANTCNRIARLNADGTVDNSFATGTGFNNTVNAVVIQSDGKLVVGGDFTAYSNSANNTCYYIARLNSSGSQDNSFNIPASNPIRFNAPVKAIAVQANGSILVGGAFTAYINNTTGTSTPRYAVSRLLSAGGDDPSFIPLLLPNSQGNPSVEVVFMPTGSTILVGGNNLDANGAVIKRLTNTGSIDGTFTCPINGVNSSTFAIGLQGTSILLGGRFGSSGSSNLVRLTTTNSLDPSFTPSVGVGAEINAIAVQSDSKVIAGGTFSSGITRLTPSGTIDNTSQSGPTGLIYTWNSTPSGAPNNTVSGSNNQFLTVRSGAIYTATATFGSQQVTSNPVTVTFPTSLTINSPTNVTEGFYSSIIVNSGGIAQMIGSAWVRSAVVRTGGTMILNGSYIMPDGASTFTLEPGATLSVGDGAGITTSGPTGAVRTSTRNFAADANYIYTSPNNTTGSTTGNGLPAQVRNLTFNAPAHGGAAATLRLTNPTAVNQALTIAAGDNLDLSGQMLVLRSDAAGTALVVNSGAGRVLGTATMERYIDQTFNAGTGYRYYSPPVTGPTATVSSLATAGFVPSVTPPNVFSYDPTLLNTPASSIASGLVPITSFSDPLVAGKGYALILPVSAKVTFAGTLNTGPLDVALPARNAGPRAAKAGWNLVGNPYPAPLDWSLVAPGDRPNLDAAIYTYISTGPNAGFYTASVNGWGDSPVVTAGQSFFVRSSDTPTVPATAPTVKFKDSQRITSFGTQPAFNRTAAGGRGVEMSFHDGGGGGGGKPPRMAVYESNGVSATGFNSSADAYRIINPNGPNLSITSLSPTPLPEDELAVKAFPPASLTSGMLVPLTVTVFQAGTYTVVGGVVQGLDPGVSAYLDDLQNGSSVNLDVAPRKYSFTLPTAPTGPIIGRFRLRFGPTVVTATSAQAATHDVALYPNPAQNQVWVQIPGVPGTTEVQATLFNELGQVVHQQVAPLAATGIRLQLNLQGFARGVYALRLQLGSATVVRRLVVE